MRVSAQQYAQTLYDLTDGKSKPEIEKAIADFARHMEKERKLKLAGKVIEHFGKIYNEKNGIVEAEVVTAEKISGEMEKKVKKYIEKKYPPHRRTSSAGEVILKNIIDPSIKGGMVLKVGDEILDGSIAGRLGELKKILSN
ncbi:MAG: F0F1 ATP synthase subunit delta [Candidatus Moranbacteria bacterium]|nr:F0F1 ATP synthase subunit delta [Candidatus Moranbacteria bacterium]